MKYVFFLKIVLNKNLHADLLTNRISNINNRKYESTQLYAQATTNNKPRRNEQKNNKPNGLLGDMIHLKVLQTTTQLQVHRQQSISTTSW
jgi:hypothetical protein